MKDKIKQLILGLGADVCGVANIDRFAEAPVGFHPRDIFSGCRSVMVFGIALPKGLTKIEPRLIYGHFNNAACPEVDGIAFKAAKEIERLWGGYAIPLPADSPYEYWDAEKHGNLLTVGAVLTELDLDSDPFAESICIEGCNICIKNCPAQALDGQRADQQKCRQNTYGTNARGFSTVNCNKCRVVCPMRFGRIGLPPGNV